MGLPRFALGPLGFSDLGSRIRAVHIRLLISFGSLTVQRRFSVLSQVPNITLFLRHHQNCRLSPTISALHRDEDSVCLTNFICPPSGLASVGLCSPSISLLVRLASVGLCSPSGKTNFFGAISLRQFAQQKTQFFGRIIPLLIVVSCICLLRILKKLFVQVIDSRPKGVMEPMMVEILESSFVVPSEETPSETLVLSNLDLVATRKLNYHLYLYKNTHGANDFFSAELLKSALAKALVLFYPLAGRQVVGHDGRDHIVCNAEGLLFVVAQMDRTADSIKFEPMSPELREHFIPKEQQLSSLLMLQVTYLQCGSVVLGSASNHILLDAWSLTHFKKTWSSIVRGDLKGIVPPSFDNTPLRPRSSPKISFDYPECTTDQTKIGDTPDSCVLSVLRLSKEQVSYLKRRCSQYRKATSVSTFSAVSALVWKCYCLAQGLPLDSKSRLYFTVDIRNRLNPPLIAYFGNAVMRMSATSQVSKIMSNPIGDVAATIKASVDKVTDEYIRSYFDYLEVEGTQIKKVAPAESDLRIRTILGMGLTDIDFGWGVPQLYSWERYTESRVVFIVNEPGKDGCLKVVPALDSSIMPKFKVVFYEELLFGRSLL